MGAPTRIPARHRQSTVTGRTTTGPGGDRGGHRGGSAVLSCAPLLDKVDVRCRLDWRSHEPRHCHERDERGDRLFINIGTRRRTANGSRRARQRRGIGSSMARTHPQLKIWPGRRSSVRTSRIGSYAARITRSRSFANPRHARPAERHWLENWYACAKTSYSHGTVGGG